MGIEYTIRFKRPPHSELDCSIRGLPYFRDFDESYQNYNLWNDPTSSCTGMPDVRVVIENDGIYYCDSGAIFSGIHESLLNLAKRFDPNATVEEL